MIWAFSPLNNISWSGGISAINLGSIYANRIASSRYLAGIFAPVDTGKSRDVWTHRGWYNAVPIAFINCLVVLSSCRGNG